MGSSTSSVSGQTMQDKLSESPRCNDMVANLHFPIFWHSHSMWNSTAFSEKRSESRSQLQCKNISILSVVQPWTSRDWKLSYSNRPYIIYESFKSWKEGFAKFHVSLWEMWRKFKCRRSMSYPPVSGRLRQYCPLARFWVATQCFCEILPLNYAPESYGLD